MARYLHAMYDIELDTNDKELNKLVKKHVQRLGSSDSNMVNYWHSYIDSMNLDSEKTNTNEQSASNTKKIMYRGKVFVLDKD